MNQVELEEQMVDGGRSRALAGIERNEDGGKAYNNVYASAVYRRFVLPLADAIQLLCTKVAPGPMAGARSLLRGIEPKAAAFITVRNILGLVVSRDETPLSHVSMATGRSIYGEMMLGKFEDLQPELYYTLVNDLEKRMSKDERHRMTIFKMSAQTAGIPLPVWSNSDTVSVGTVLLHLAKDVGLVEFEKVHRRGKTPTMVTLVPEVAGLLEQVSEFVAGMSPQVLPCVEPPRPWTTSNGGGYHTIGMRRSAPCIIRGQSSVRDGDVPDEIREAVNTLQEMPWQINDRVLRAVDEVSQHYDVGEVLSQAELPKPPRPEWLTEDLGKENMNSVQLAAFSQWKAEVREWHTQRKLRGVQWGRYYESIRIARLVSGRPLYFVHQLDYRGRVYAITRGPNPQGSDLQKSLLIALHGRRMDSPNAVKWFKIAGANRFGFDKAPLHERVAWTDERHELIMAIAQDPISNRGWTEADSPFQFLAWCFEYADWTFDPTTFHTRLPLGQDGSCNGLQHFSAMFRDHIGGAATNLVPGEVQQDIYRLVAEETARILLSEPDDGSHVGKLWRLHPLTRALVKRSVMTLPYGSTRYSCADFIQTEYLQAGMFPEVHRGLYGQAANWLSYRVWDAIGRVVIKARDAMAWLQRGAGMLVGDGAKEIAWRSPSGFMVRQTYWKVEVVQITTRLVGGVRIRPMIPNQTDIPDKRRHMNGIAPNFIHACDAAHLHKLVMAAKRAGIPFLAMIHDDYGALAPDIEKLHQLIRETFIDLYRDNDPVRDFAVTHGLTHKIPARGTLNLEEVLNSDYFFC